MNDNDRIAGIAKKSPQDIGVEVASMMQDTFPHFLVDEAPAFYVASVIMNIIEARDLDRRAYPNFPDLKAMPNVWHTVETRYPEWHIALCTKDYIQKP